MKTIQLILAIIIMTISTNTIAQTMTKKQKDAEKIFINNADEALQMMKVGSKWKLFIPSELAYGDRQAGPTILPHSTLVFDVELISIKGK